MAARIAQIVPLRAPGSRYVCPSLTRHINITLSRIGEDALGRYRYLSIARPLEGVGRLDYRRGIEREHNKLKWQRLWHFNEACASYPTRNFIVRNDRPRSSELCSDCGQANGPEAEEGKSH